MPVSYTHLDVYKRQCQTCALPIFVDALVLAEGLALVEALVLALVDALVPVSYTHLKRFREH